MNWKIALALSALVTSVAAFAACGGTDPCTQAEAQLAACHSDLAAISSSSSSSGMAAACPLTDCQAACINNAACSDITTNQPAFATCLHGCSPGK
jgi:hypothetical protein